MTILLLQKIRGVGARIFAQLHWDVSIANIDPTAWKVVVQFRPELSPNEAHSYAYLLQHTEFNVTKNEMQAKVKDLPSHGYYSDALILFQNFSPNVDSVHNTSCYVRRSESVAELVLEI